jgi:hypothetical protein
MNQLIPFRTAESAYPEIGCSRTKLRTALNLCPFPSASFRYDTAIR